MSNIEIPEEIQANAQRVLDGRENFISSTVQLAEFILGLGKPEIEVEPFVLYKVQVREDDEPRIGFRFTKSVPYPWVTICCHSPEKEDAYPVALESMIHSDEDVKVLERWTPEPVFGIGEPGEDIAPDREVLVRGVLRSPFVDTDGDVRVEMNFAGSVSTTHYVSAADVALVEEV